MHGKEGIWSGVGEDVDMLGRLDTASDQGTRGDEGRGYSTYSYVFVNEENGRDWRGRVGKGKSERG